MAAIQPNQCKQIKLNNTILKNITPKQISFENQLFKIFEPIKYLKTNILKHLR